MSDDQTTAYVLAMQTCFEDLKQVAAQLAGLLVLEASGAAPDHPMLASARNAYRNAVDGLHSARVPLRARDHHRRLLSAAAKLDEALQRKGDSLVPLESAYAELRAASRALPGFPMISFEHGCCAHAGRSAA
ncbi:MAG TPA: hypothetical protein VHY84_04720 [Bryobacteraceae bacterium]|jgi:hypothetical protein|nr:hypothetical protein [Bryobacteraceae bacterium]